MSLQSLHDATKVNLQVRLQGTNYANDWDLWIYPTQLAALTSDILVTSDVQAGLDRLQLVVRFFCHSTLRVLQGIAWAPLDLSSGIASPFPRTRFIP